MDSEAWRTVIHGVAKSQAWLSDWTELMMAVLTGVRWCLIIVLIYISLIIGELEHLCLCFLAICMSSLEKCLCRSYTLFSNELFFSCVKLYEFFFFFFNVFWRLSSYQLLCLQFFLPFWVLSFHFVYGFISVQNVLSLIKFHLFIFVLFSLLSEMDQWRSHCDLCQRVFCLCFPLRDLQC